MIRFEHSIYLLALALVPLFIFLYVTVIKWKRFTVKKIGDESLVKQLFGNYSPKRFLYKFVLVTIAFTAMVIAFSNPRIATGSVKLNRTGIDLMIAIDVSKSMLAQDVKPTRLERAKQLVARLIDKLPDDRIGLVVFAGRAYLQMPLTTDHSAAKMYLSSISTDVVPTQGTVVKDALKMCYAGFDTKENKYKAIVLISDGEDHDEDVGKITKALASEGIVTNTIGIGSPDGATIYDPATHEIKKDNEGNVVISRLNEGELQEIAKNGNGIYQLFTNADDVISRLDAALKNLGERAITEKSLTNYNNFFPWFLGVALLALLADLFTSENKRQRQVKKKLVTKPSISVSIFLFISFSSFAQDGEKMIGNGNEAYKKKDYQKAAEYYRKIPQKDPASEKAQYNLGNALYKSGKAKEAVDAYNIAIGKSSVADDKEQALYNKGVVYQNNKKLDECIDAYKKALRINPADEDARLNLQKALQKKKEDQKNENDKKNQNKDKKQNEQQKPQPQKPQPSNITKQEAEEKLKALLQQEKNLQNKLRKVNVSSPEKPEKDW